MRSSSIREPSDNTSDYFSRKRDIFRRPPLIAAWLITSILPFALFSQERPTAQPPSTESPLPQKPEESVTTYLDRQIALRSNESIKTQIKRDILLLYRLSKNFGKEVQNSDQTLAHIRDLYRQGMEHYYRGEAILAKRSLDEARVISLGLFKKFSEHFGKQISELLSTCSESMVNKEMESSLDPGNGRISDALIENHYKLKIAYAQTATAEALIRDDRYDTAIDHYRIAKIYAVRILKDLEMDANKKAALEEKYRVDLIDAVGGVADNPVSGEKPQ
jgi:hypothetical protein